MSEEMRTADTVAKEHLQRGTEMVKFILNAVRGCRPFYLGESDKRPQWLLGEIYDCATNSFILDYFTSTSHFLNLVRPERLSAEFATEIAEFKRLCDLQLDEMRDLARDIKPFIGLDRSLRLAGTIGIFTFGKNLFFQGLTSSHSELYQQIGDLARVGIGLTAARICLDQIGSGFRIRERQLLAAGPYPEVSGTCDENADGPFQTMFERLLKRFSDIERRQIEQAKSLAKQDALSTRLDKNTERILRAIRNENEKSFDKRSPKERQLIDRAALHYVRRRYLDGLDIPVSDCIRHIWNKHGDTSVFRDSAAFANAVRYDLDKFYDLNILIARAKTERPI